MTITTRQIIVDMLEALRKGERYDDWENLYSIYEYTNKMNKQVMWAVFTEARFEDIYESLFVEKVIPLYVNGEFLQQPSKGGDF